MTSLSEFGIDYGLGHGSFNALADESGGDFNQYWWKETCTFESFLGKEFPEDTIFVSDNVPHYKSFGIWPENRPPFDQLCESAVSYLRERHPDASVVLANPLGFPLGAGRIVLAANRAWMDRDLVFWFLKRSDSLATKVLASEELRRNANSVDIRNLLPWLGQFKFELLKPQMFWDLAYKGCGAPLVGRTEKQKDRGIGLGNDIVTRLTQRYFELNEDESADVYVSNSFRDHKIVKVECARKVIDAEFVENVVRIVNGIDGSWFVRFSVFESLILDDCYLGSFIARPDERFVLEGEGQAP